MNSNIMIRSICISLGLWLLPGCNPAGESKKIIGPEKPFILTANEVSLLQADPCGYEVSLDTIVSLSQYYRIREDFFAAGKDSASKFCISFNYKYSDTGRPQKLVIHFNPAPSYSRGGNLPPENYLLVNIRDSARVFDVLGAVHAFDGTPTEELYKYVQQFYLQLTDSSTMRDRFMNMRFPSDSVTYIGKYVSQLVKGYILAQRELSLKFYNKELQYATPEELTALRNRSPFLFKLNRNKSPHYKTTH